MSGQPNANQTVSVNSLTSLGVHIASLQIHRSLDSRDVSINVQIVTVIGTHLSQNIGGLILGQGQLDLDIGRSSFNSIIQLVLLLIQIDLLTIRSDEETIL